MEIMKKLLFIMCILLIIGGCSMDYKDINPKEPISGTIVAIDSTQWTPVLMQVHKDELIILDNNEIRRIDLIDPIIYVFMFLLICTVMVLFIILCSS